MIFPFSECISHIEPVDSLLVRHDNIFLVRHALRDPVMSPDCLHPPDLADILKTYTVHLIGSVLLEELSQTNDPFSRAVDIWEHNGHQIFLPYSAFDQRICAENSRVGSDGFRGSHRYIAGIDAGLPPYSLIRERIRHRCVPHGIIRKVDLDLRDNGFIMSRLLLRRDHDEFFGSEFTGRRILVPRHER